MALTAAAHLDALPALVAPLPLEPFEAFMLADDRADYPMCFFFQLDFAGVLQHGAFVAALRAAQQRHPLLSALIKEKKGRASFVPAPGAEPFLDWDLAERPLTCPHGIGIALHQEIGLRVWVRLGAAASLVFLQFHHACCDGIGALQFIEDLLAEYARGVGAAITSRPLKPELLCGRGRFDAPPLPPGRQQRLWGAFAGVRRAVSFLTQTPVALATPTRQGQTAGAMPFPGFVSHRFTCAETGLLRVACTRLGVTLNDLALAALFQAIVQWNAAHPWGDHHGFVRILVPMNLRQDAAELPAANGISYAFIDRPWRVCQEFAALLRGIHAETRALKSSRGSHSFLNDLSLLNGVRGLLSFVVRKRRCFATAVLSNLGEPTERFVTQFPRREGRCVLGDVLLDNIVAVPPIRPQTRAGMCLITCAQRLSIGLKWDPFTFTQKNAEEFLAHFVQRLRDVSGIAS